MTLTLEKTLIDLEHRYWQAMKDQDIEAATALTDDRCVITGAQGVSTIDKERFAEMMRSGGWALEDFTFSDVQVNRLGRNVAIVAYNVHENLTVDGEQVSLDASDASTWVRKDGTWLCALHAESLAGDPFGRDRRS